METKAILLSVWLIASLLALFWNETFWFGLWSLCACIIVGRKYYEDGGSDAEGLC